MKVLEEVYVWIFDPDSGLRDPNLQITTAGQTETGASCKTASKIIGVQRPFVKSIYESRLSKKNA